MKRKAMAVNLPVESSREIYSCTNVLSSCNSYVHDESICENLNSYFKSVYKEENMNFVPESWPVPNFLEEMDIE